jgi:hypothetical protein
VKQSLGPPKSPTRLSQTTESRSFPRQLPNPPLGPFAMGGSGLDLWRRERHNHRAQ